MVASVGDIRMDDREEDWSMSVIVDNEVFISK
jgi:hypothetical protein